MPVYPDAEEPPENEPKFTLEEYIAICKRVGKDQYLLFRELYYAHKLKHGWTLKKVGRHGRLYYFGPPSQIHPTDGEMHGYVEDRFLE